MVPMLCFSSRLGVVLTFPWHVFMLRWTDMLSWSIRRRTRARKSGNLLLAGPIQDFRMCCSRLLSLTGGCNSHREECKKSNDFDWAAHTGAMFWPELEAHLYHSCCCALFTSGQSEHTNKGLWPWELPSAYISIDLCFPALSVLHEENKDLKEMLLRKENPPNPRQKNNGPTYHYVVKCWRNNPKNTHRTN